MIPETVVTWKWHTPSYHTQFNSGHVNILYNMVKRNFPGMKRFVCVTDDPSGIKDGIEIVPLGDQFAGIKNPSIHNGPSCYRRLRMFSKEAESLFGKRFVSLDLDCVITGELTSLWDTDKPFKAWGDTSRRNKYNGSMILLTAGARSEIWEKFDPIESPSLTRKAGLLGSDQAWIHYCLGPSEPIWRKEDGVYSFRNHIENKMDTLPENARIVFFHGNLNPWDEPIRVKYRWIDDFYR